MDYKKLIKSRATREAILRVLSFVPDKLMLKIQYRIKTGRKLELKNPKRFTEKLQWYKLYYRDPQMKQCVDKYDVRDYVRACGLEQILIGDYGAFDSVRDIPWESLPEKFVLKDTLGGGGNGVLICSRKDMDRNEAERTLQRWIDIPYHTKHSGREWVYEGKKHRVYIEDFVDADKEKGGLIDYKFFCFGGRFEYLYVIADRVFGQGAGLGIYDRTYHKLDVVRCDEQPLRRDVPKPEVFEKMIEIVETLAKPFPEVRVDLFYQNGRIYFGEMTFFDGSGYMKFDPDDFDYIMGESFILPEIPGGGTEVTLFEAGRSPLPCKEVVA